MTLWEHAGALGSFLGGIGMLFYLVELATKRNSRLRTIVAQSLQQTKRRRAVPNWSQTYIAIFDGMFGRSHISWQCFRSSCRASFIFIFVVVVLMCIIRNVSFRKTFSSISLDVIIGFYMLPIFLNLFFDYFSLLKSRYIIYFMGKHYPSNIIFTTLILLSDFIITLIIACIAFFIDFHIIGLFIGGIGYHQDVYLLASQNYSIKEIGKITVKMLINPFLIFIESVNLNHALGIFFYATIFTSIWIWLFVISRFLVKQIKSIFYIGQALELNIEEYPVYAIGAVSMIVATIIYIVSALISVLLR